MDDWFPSPVLLAEAKGVAGLGKAGGDGQAGSDKAGQQVPPEVYMALTYAGTLFLFTLSVPLILYGLNKLLNKIEDCFGCGPSSRQKKAAQTKQQRETTIPGAMYAKNQQQSNLVNNSNQNNIASIDQSLFHPDSNTTKQYQHNQRLNLQLLQQHPKYTQFISMSKPDYNMPSSETSPDKATSQHQPLVDANQHQQHPHQNDQEISLPPNVT